MDVIEIPYVTNRLLGTITPKPRIFQDRKDALEFFSEWLRILSMTFIFWFNSEIPEILFNKKPSSQVKQKQLLFIKKVRKQLHKDKEPNK